MSRPQVLVCQDYDGGRFISPVLERIAKEGALGGVTLKQIPHWRDAERIIPTYYVTFDAGRLRNTEAHGIGCRYGFVCHVQELVEVVPEPCNRSTPGCSVAGDHSTCETW